MTVTATTESNVEEAPQQQRSSSSSQSSPLRPRPRRRVVRYSHRLKRIPLPSFAPILPPSSNHKSSLQIVGDSTTSNNTSTDNSLVTVLVQTTKHSNTSQKRTSRIGGILSYQRFRQHVNPTLYPPQYTRKEIRIMNQETPERASDHHDGDEHGLNSNRLDNQSNNYNNNHNNNTKAKSGAATQPKSLFGRKMDHKEDSHHAKLIMDHSHNNNNMETQRIDLPCFDSAEPPTAVHDDGLSETTTSTTNYEHGSQNQKETAPLSASGTTSTVVACDNALEAKHHRDDTEDATSNNSPLTTNAKTTTNADTQNTTTLASSSPPPSKPQPPPPPPPRRQFRLYFVPRGRDMHDDVLVGPKNNARARGAMVLEHFDASRHADNDDDDNKSSNTELPTHIVVGSVQNPRVIVAACGFATHPGSGNNNNAQQPDDDNDDLVRFRQFLYRHNIQCVTRAWAAKVSNQPYQEPRRFRQPAEIYTPLTPIAPPTSLQPQPQEQQQQSSSPPSKRQRKNPPGPNEIMDTSTHLSNLYRRRGRNNNVQLAALFTELSKAYQQAPLDKIDTWRSYTFATVASRLQALPFTVNDTTSLERLRKDVLGFGDSTCNIIREFIEKRQEMMEDENDDENDAEGNDVSGVENKEITVSRLQQIRSDRKRRAMRVMMQIWGVGRAKALELVQAGYTNIESIRRDFDGRRLRVKLQRNQYIGLLCYHDILEEMDRREVERIRDVIQAAVREFYSQAQVQVMGSYRRGKERCGDVDILITHPKYAEKVPAKALGRIMDRLRVQGHVAYHLTQLAGMDTDAFETLPRDIAQRLGQPSISSSSTIYLRPKRDKTDCSSYMGIFHSPTIPGKKRRVDVKFYPYRERVFAALYFTGNGYFNRSMRLWAKRKFGYKLSDHGMFHEGGGRATEDVRVMDAMDERQIFRRLNLQWKEPHERDGFDAVVGMDSKRATELKEWSKEEFFREEGNHVWID